MPSEKDYSEDINSIFFNEQNKKKEKELKEKFGMKSMGFNENASPELINKFLNNVQQFEEAYEKAETKKIFEILNSPNFKKLEMLNPEEIPSEINKVLDIYAKNNMCVDIIEEADVSDSDFYKFLTEELPQQETDYINIEGMTTNFIYEEFHPSDKLDAKDTISNFLSSLLHNNVDNMKTWLSKDELCFNKNHVSVSEFITSMIKLVPEKVIENEILYREFDFCEVKRVKVDFIIHYEESVRGYLKQKQINLHIAFGLEKCEYGLFDIISCDIEPE